MKIIIVGNDIRSLALSRALLNEGYRVVCIPGPEDSSITNVPFISLPNNDGYSVPWQNMRRVDEISRVVLSHTPDLVVCLHVESSDAGLPDLLRYTSKGKLPVFGVSRLGSRLEVSKIYGLGVARNSGFLIPDFQVIGQTEREIWLSSNKSSHNRKLVLKADGLAGGRGTLFSHDFESLSDALAGLPEGDIVVQDFVDGDEFAISLICSGSDIEVLNINFEYKRSLDGNKGMNTPGMGTVARTAKDLAWASRVVKGLGQQLKELDYFGPLDISFILERKKKRPVFLEFTARFGDPELSSEILLLDNFGESLINVANRRKAYLQFNERVWAAGVVVHSGAPKELLDTNQLGDFEGITHESINSRNGTEHCFSASDVSFENTIRRIYREIEKMPSGSITYRRDIGFDALPRWNSVQEFFTIPAADPMLQ